MKRFGWQIALGTILIALSAVLYLLEIVLFRSPRDTFFYLVQDVAFIPIQVLLVTLVVNGLLSRREKRSRLEKLNMVIGAFFSEMGTELLTLFSDADPRLGEIRKNLLVRGDWSDREFADVSKRLKTYSYSIDIEKVDLPFLRSDLLAKRNFMLRLLENPNLLEHESFTELLLAVFHLVEEMACREDVASLPETDLKHIAGDMGRAYRLLVHEWLAYMRHLKEQYPYLFSLAMRLNPFDGTASPIVRE